MAVAISDTLAFLLGHWSIERTIEDHRDAARVHFSGTAVIESTPAGAQYSETGQLSTPAHTGPARRTLSLCRLKDGTVRLDFPDGRPFLDLDLSSGRTQVSHPCRADTYAMAFEVLGPDALLEHWHVTGPAKHYTAETRWRRAD